MIEERVAKFLQRSAQKFYHMYKEAQELLDDYNYKYRRVNVIDLEHHCGKQAPGSKKKIKKLGKKIEAFGEKIKKERLIELSDNEESVKKENIKNEACKLNNDTEESIKKVNLKNEAFKWNNDAEESIKKVTIKNEACKWNNDTEDTLFDRNPFPIKDETEFENMDEYTKANSGPNYNQFVDYSHMFYYPQTIPSNAVEFLDLDK